MEIRLSSCHLVVDGRIISWDGGGYHVASLLPVSKESARYSCQFKKSFLSHLCFQSLVQDLTLFYRVTVKPEKGIMLS
jgi:hypothetical protein